MKGWIIRNKSGKEGLTDAHDWHPESLSFVAESEAWDSWFLANPLEESGEHESVEVEVREVDLEPPW